MPSTKRHLDRVKGTVKSLFAKPATLTAVQVCSGFAQLTLEGPSLQDVRWQPGQKLQVLLSPQCCRTYTPSTWDSQLGRTTLLVHLHGSGPGSAWAQRAHEGQSCTLFGPRDSLAVHGAPLVVFGDESSLGLVYAALHSHVPGVPAARVVLEAQAPAEIDKLLRAFPPPGLDPSQVTILAKTPAGEHLHSAVEALLQALSGAPDRVAVLSGNAASLAFVVKQLRQRGLARRRLQTRAYWAQGKTGLD